MKNLEYLRQEAQQTLTEFLNNDLDLCFTLLDLAQHEEGEHLKQLLQNARKGLETIRHFEGRITDQQAWSRIHQRADELDRQLSNVESSN